MYLHRLPQLLSAFGVDPSQLPAATSCDAAALALALPGLGIWAAHAAVGALLAPRRQALQGMAVASWSGSGSFSDEDRLASGADTAQLIGRRRSTVGPAMAATPATSFLTLSYRHAVCGDGRGVWPPCCLLVHCPCAPLTALPVLPGAATSRWFGQPPWPFTLSLSCLRRPACRRCPGGPAAVEGGAAHAAQEHRACVLPTLRRLTGPTPPSCPDPPSLQLVAATVQPLLGVVGVHSAALPAPAVHPAVVAFIQGCLLLLGTGSSLALLALTNYGAGSGTGTAAPPARLRAATSGA